MQALERTYMDDNWITLVLVFLVFLVFLLKVLDPKKLIGYVLAPITKSFIEDEIEENTSFFETFQVIISLFSVTVLSLLSYKIIIDYVANIREGFLSFFVIFGLIFFYFLIKWGLEYLFSIVFELRKSTRFFLVSKFSYLYAISFVLFGGIIIVQYTQLGTEFLLKLAVFFFILRFLWHIFFNKKLIFSKLFYFILYFCTFEIAPLLILFKLMF